MGFFELLGAVGSFATIPDSISAKLNNDSKSFRNQIRKIVVESCISNLRH